MITIAQVESPGELARARELFTEYAASLDFELAFQGFDAEVASLPGEYAPPRGLLLLAYYERELAACGALRPAGEGSCEMKRLYVRPAFRRKGIARALAAALIARAGELGYERMRLDTVAAMGAANALYRALGFREIAPYRYNPLPGATFFELDLR